jgi:hypothetical protein
MMRDLSLAAPLHGSSEPVSAATELQQVLWAWKGHCLDGATALAARDTEALERSIAARDALRPRIESLIATLDHAGGPSPEAFAAVERLQQEAAAAEGRLVALLGAEVTRVRRDTDRIGRASASTAAYGRPDAPSPHRLDIVR